MAIFHHPFTDIEKLSIVTPFEPDFSFFIPTKDHPPYWGEKAKRNLLLSYKRSNAWYWKANMRKIEFQKLLSSPLREIWVSKSKAKMLEREPKKNVEEKWIEKNGLKWKWRETRKEDQSRIGPHKNDSWFNDPETQFEPTYHFFRNPKPRPTLRAVKVHFDWTWIPRLKRFFSLRNFHPKSSW